MMTCLRWSIVRVKRSCAKRLARWTSTIICSSPHLRTRKAAQSQYSFFLLASEQDAAGPYVPPYQELSSLSPAAALHQQKWVRRHLGVLQPCYPHSFWLLLSLLCES